MAFCSLSILSRDWNWALHLNILRNCILTTTTLSRNQWKFTDLTLPSSRLWPPEVIVAVCCECQLHFLLQFLNLWPGFPNDRTKFNVWPRTKTAVSCPTRSFWASIRAAWDSKTSTSELIFSLKLVILSTNDEHSFSNSSLFENFDGSKTLILYSLSKLILTFSSIRIAKVVNTIEKKTETTLQFVRSCFNLQLFRFGWLF